MPCMLEDAQKSVTRRHGYVHASEKAFAGRQAVENASTYISGIAGEHACRNIVARMARRFCRRGHVRSRWRKDN